MDSYRFKDPSKELMDRIKDIQFKDPSKVIMDTYRFKDPNKEIMDSYRFKDPSKVIMDTYRFKDPTKEIMDSYRFKDLSNGIMDSYRFKNPTKEIMDRIFQDPFKEFLNRIKSFQFEDTFKEIRNSLSKYHDLTNVYRNIFSDSLPANTFEAAYQEVLSKFVIEKHRSNGDVVEAVIHTVDEFNHFTEIFQPSKLSFEFYINFVIAVMFFLYSMHLSEQSELQIRQSIEYSQSIILEKLNEYNVPDKYETYYIVQRAVYLQTKPTTKKFIVINVLYPNQKVRLIEKKGEWLKIEYYNYNLDIHGNGWCLKKYLKMAKQGPNKGLILYKK